MPSAKPAASQAAAQGEPARPALHGLRVIDIATVIAAPYCATLLGEFGADVLKLEHPDGGDALRRFGLSRFTTDEQIDYAINHVKEAVTKLREMSDW